MHIYSVAFLARASIAIGVLGSFKWQYTWPAIMVIGLLFATLDILQRRTLWFCMGVFLGGLPWWLIATVSIAASSGEWDWEIFPYLFPQTFVVPTLFLIGVFVGNIYVRFYEKKRIDGFEYTTKGGDSHEK